LAPGVAEAVVACKLRRREHLTVVSGVGERLRDRQVSKLRRQLVTADEDEATGTTREHRREVAAERLRGGLGRGVVRLRRRDGLSEQRGDAVEAALDARLPRAVGEQSRDANGCADLVPDNLHEGELALRERAVALNV